MGRRNRSSSFQVGNNVHNNSNHHLLGIKIIKSSAASATTTANTTSMGSNHNTINNSSNNSKAIIGTTKEDLSAATTLSRQFVHSMNKEGRTPFLCAVSAAASNTSASASSVVAAAAAAVGRNEVNRNENDTSSSRRIIIDGGEGQRNNHQDNNDKERERMDGLFIMDMLATRMKEMDALLSFTLSSSSSSSSVSSSLLSKKKKKKKNVGQANHKSSGNNSNSNNNSSSSSSKSHFYQLMTTRDKESGYTPLHYSILQRDLMTMLLLLKHASTASLEERDAVVSSLWLERRSSSDGGNAGFNYNSISSSSSSSNTNTSLSLHPLRLLDGNLNNTDDNAHNDEDGSNQYNIINALASSVDKEGLTPLQLLGKSSCGGLEHCRRTLTWRSLREGWMEQERARRGGMPQQQQQQQQQLSISTSLSAASPMEESSPVSGRYRRRMISFGDDRDYDSLQYEIDSGDTNNNNDNDINGEGRLRGGSFSINLNDDHISDDESGDDNNDLIPLDDVDFNVLADENNHEDEEGEEEDGRGGANAQQQERRRQHHFQREKSDTDTNDYGCEVLTFGRADHCALGVPQLSSRIRSDYNGKGGKDDNNNFFSSSSFEKTYKPKRVETFALGSLRRNWSSSKTRCGGDSLKRDRRNEIDSPAVAVAASTHHTLVATRSGQLFSFGLGKGGRLGVGDESHRPLPTRILGPLVKRIVASIAAAENHSLCSTSDGAVFAWGSNGFGQLGIQSSRGHAQQNQDGTVGGGSRLSPRRVEGELKHSFVVGVACGERHSVALTRLGEVYCWGDNKKGQLGVINVAETQSNGPRRVEGLWSVHPRRRAIAVSAAAYSTLVLTMPPTISAGVERESSLASLPVNTVYGWGHGNHSPLRVVFPTGNSFASQSGSANAYSRMICINPIAIACAKYHNVAITKDGKVYTWGLHTDSLGVPQQTSFTKQKSRSNSINSSSSSSMFSSPQLVTGMLPENGGGNAVAVSASESHTAIVTSDGHVFNWGESEGKDVLGHKGVRWQPSPRRVKRVHRAVAVAAGKEHTVMLIGTTFPPLPNVNRADGTLSLQHTAAVEISRNVDLFNVIPLALVAYRFNCGPLINFCELFIRNNLDGVLAVGMKNDFDAFLSSRTIVGTNDYEHDGVFHPALHLMVNTNCWVYSGKALLKQYESAIAPPTKKTKKNVVNRERKTSLSVPTKVEEVKPNRRRELIASLKITSGEENNESITPTNLKKAPETEAKTNLSPPAPAPTVRGKYYCNLCDISCPDSDSYTLHIHGRKHRNREMHAEAAEEKSVAESMMAMKRMQLVEKSGEDYARITFDRSTRQNDKSNIAWGTQQSNFCGGLSPVAPQKGKSFQDILKEEQKNMSMSTVSHRKGESSPGSKSLASLTPTKTNSAPLSSPSLATNRKNPPLPARATGASPTLGSFIARKAEPKHDGVSSVGASWGASPVNKAKNSNLNWGLKQPAVQTAPKATQSPQKLRSFSEIQKEEEALRKNEDHMCCIDGNQWFVQQRERAASIGEIQQMEQQEQEMLDLIEEQKQIEMAIMKSIQEESALKKKQKKSKHNQQRRNKKKPPTKSRSKSNNLAPS